MLDIGSGHVDPQCFSAFNQCFSAFKSIEGRLGQTTGPATEIQNAAVRLNGHKVEEGSGQQSAPAADEKLVSSGVGRGKTRERFRVRPQSGERSRVSAP